jgi:hypothetical protein
MRTFNFVCAGIALTGVIVSAILWRDLRTQQELMAEWQRAHPQAASSNPEQLPRSPPAATSTPPAQAGTLDQVSAARPAAPGISERVASEQALFQDPEYRRNLLSRLRQLAPQENPGLVEKLGLSADEASKLFDLLAQRQLEETSLLVMNSSSGTNDPAATGRMLRGRQELERRHEESVASLLGGARFQKWQEYQEIRRAQQEVQRQYAGAMQTQGQPLSEKQVQALGAILIAERRRQQQEVQSMRGSTPPTPPNLAQLLEASARRQVESNGRIIAAATAHLTAQQLQSLRTTLEQQVTSLNQQVTALRGSTPSR